jgi:hypothetical protein
MRHLERTSAMRVAVACLVLFGLAACSTPEPPRMLSVYNGDDFHFWTAKGDSTIAGQAFVKLPSGQVVTCAGETVLLIPATSYNLELEQNLEKGTGIPVDYDRHALQFEQKTVCDGTGRFAFDGLPHLNWLVVTRVNWQDAPSIPALASVGLSSPTKVGGYLFTEKKLESGTNKVLLTTEDFVKDVE